MFKTLSGREIKAIRERLELTQVDFAYMLRCSPTTVSRWENGITSIRGVYVQAIRRLEEEINRG